MDTEGLIANTPVISGHQGVSNEKFYKKKKKRLKKFFIGVFHPVAMSYMKKFSISNDQDK